MDKSRGVRTGRGRSHRHARVQGLLSEVDLSSLDERLADSAPVHRERRESKTGLRALRLSHLAFLLVGLLGGVGLLVLGQFLLKLGNTQPPAPPPPPVVKPLPKPLPEPPAPQPHPISSSDPAAIVRAMLKSAVAKDSATARAYWGIGPTDVAFTGNGMQLSLQDSIAATQQGVAMAPVDSFEFRVRERQGATAVVGQYNAGICSQIYTLQRQGNTWKIMNATLP